MLWVNACLPVRYAMTDHVVHRCTDRLGETPVSERRWVGVVLDCLLVRDEVYFIRCHTNLEATGHNCHVVFVVFHDMKTQTLLVVIRCSPSNCVQLVAVRVWRADMLWWGLRSALGLWSLCSLATLGPVYCLHSQAAQCATVREERKDRIWRVGHIVAWAGIENVVFNWVIVTNGSNKDYSNGRGLTCRGPVIEINTFISMVFFNLIKMWHVSHFHLTGNY